MSMKIAEDRPRATTAVAVHCTGSASQTHF